MIRSDEKSKERAVINQPDLIWILAVWFGLLSGLIEVVMLGAAKFLLRKYIHVGLDLVWMAPVADLIIFSVPGCLLYLIARIRRRPVSLRLVTFLYAFLLFLSAAFTIVSLDKYAAVVLAVGLAVQVSSWIDSHPSQFFAIVRATTGWVPIFDRPNSQRNVAETPAVADLPTQLNRRQFLLGAGTTLAGLALGVNGWETFSGNRTVAKSALANSPNVLLITLDTVRAQNLSLYGYARKTTPQLERLASGGVRFARALSAAPWTLPSHASIMTGRYPHELSADWASPLDGTFATLAQVLSAQGYDTAGFIANTLYLTAESGINRGFAHYEDYTISAGRILSSARLTDALSKNDDLRRLIGFYEDPDRKDAYEVSNGLLRWLSARDQQRPFFAFLNYFDAHSPYLPPKPFDTMFGPAAPRSNERMTPGWKWSAQAIQTEMDAYDGCIAHLDQQLGLLFDELSQRRILENTLVIISADHGEEFGEHGLMTHGYSLYIPALHVPLMMMLPSVIPAGQIVESPVTLRDIPATVLDLLHLGDTSPFPGKSLARYWNGDAAPAEEIDAILSEVNKSDFSLPEDYPISKGNIKSVVMDHTHYIKRGDNHEELFDWVADEWEHQDLAVNEQGVSALARFRQSLASLLART